MDVYTDGSAFPHPQGFGGWAAVWENTTNNNCYNFISGGGFYTTSHRMEMFAISKVLEHLYEKGEENITIHTDSYDYLVNLAAQLLPDINSNIVKYEQKLKNVKYKYVKSHALNELHNLADQIACYKRIEFTNKLHEGVSESENVEIGMLDINLFKTNEDIFNLKKTLTKCFSLVINEKPYASFLSLQEALSVKEKLLITSNITSKIVETILH